MTEENGDKKHNNLGVVSLRSVRKGRGGILSWACRDLGSVLLLQERSGGWRLKGEQSHSNNMCGYIKNLMNKIIVMELY